MYAFLCLGHLSCHCSIWMNSYCTFCVSFALLDIPSAIPTKMHVFLVSRNIRKSLNDIWWYFAYLNVQEIEMPRWVIEIQFRFSKKAIKIGQIFQLIWYYFVSFKQIGRFRQMFVAFLENLNFTSKNRTANPAHPAVLFPGLFWCAFKKPIVVFQLLANVH